MKQYNLVNIAIKDNNDNYDNVIRASLWFEFVDELF